MDILLQEAMQQFTAASLMLGYPAPIRLRQKGMSGDLEQLEQAIAPLEIPGELRSWWTSWEPGSLSVLDASRIHGLAPVESRSEWENTCSLEFPRVLLPVFREEKRLLTIELASPAHPGSRLFEVGFHGESITLIGFGVVDIITLMTTALTQTFERSSDHGYPGNIDLELYQDLVRQRTGDLGSVRYGDFERAGWPSHWLAAEGFDEAWLRPRGRTHTLAEFDAEREFSGPIRGVLHGTWHTAVGGGPLEGTVGHLRDESGSIQLFIPNDTPHAGLGPDKRCEIEVVAKRSSGDSTSALRPLLGSAVSAVRGGPESAFAWILALQPVMRSLDVSVVATAVRPLAG